MAMNFLKLISNANDSSSSGGPTTGFGSSLYHDAASARGPSKPKRVYTASEQETMRQVAFLLAKMETLTLAEDRRATMDQLTQAVRDHPELPVEPAGLRTLMTLAKAIQQDRHATANVDTSLQAVEMIKILLAPHASSAAAASSAGAPAAAASQLNEDDGSSASSSAAAAAANAPLISLFVQNPNYITTLLELLEQKHSALRLLIIQCLSSLLRVRTEKLQSIVLNHPMGVIVLVELLADPSEAIRNDTLLLLELLTRGAPAIQQIVAFNGGFDQLLAIAKKDIEQDAGIIAEDALRIVSSLLADNPVTQNIFLQDPACLARLLPYLTFEEDDLKEDAGAQFEFLGLTLEILNHLVGGLDSSRLSGGGGGGGSGPPNAQKHAHMRTALSPLVHPLVRLATSGPPVAMRLEVWTLLSAVVDGHARNQTLLEAYPLEVVAWVNAAPTLQYPGYPYHEQNNTWIQGPPVLRRTRKNCLRHLLDLACDAVEPTERCVVLELLRCYFHANPTAQLRATMSFAPSPTAMARGARQPDAHHQGRNGPHPSSNSPTSGPRADVDEEVESGPALGPTLLAMLGGSRPQPVDWSGPGPEGHLYVDRARWTASRVMQQMMEGNADCQLMLLTLPLADQATTAPGASATPAAAAPSQSRLLDYFIASLFASQNHGEVESSLLALLCLWADGCLELNEAIFSRYATNLLAYLLQMARDPNVHETSRGLATYYLALVLELMSNPPTPTSATTGGANGGGGRNGGAASAAAAPFSSSIITASALLDLITKQIGLDRFKANLAGLHNSVAFQKADADRWMKVSAGGKATDLAGAARRGWMANPLTIWRKLEAEMPPADGAQAQAGDDLARQQVLVAQLHEHLALSSAFARRFQVVQDKCDQRLLNLFTSASSAPMGTTSALATAAAASNHHALAPPQSAHPTQPHASLSPMHGRSTADSTSSPMPLQHHPHAATGASVSGQSAQPLDHQLQQQQLQALREENARLQKEADQWRTSASGGDTMQHLRQLQAQVAQLQAENQALRASGGGSGGSSSNGIGGGASAELHRLRQAHDELLSEHEDLLILLASQEIELEEARRPPILAGSLRDEAAALLHLPPPREQLPNGLTFTKSAQSSLAPSAATSPREDHGGQMRTTAHAFSQAFPPVHQASTSSAAQATQAMPHSGPALPYAHANHHAFTPTATAQHPAGPEVDLR